MGAADFHILALDYRGKVIPCLSLSDPPLGLVTPRVVMLSRVPRRLRGLQRVPYRERLHHGRPGTLRLGQSAEREQQHPPLGTLLGDRVGVVTVREGCPVGAGAHSWS